MRHLVRVRVRVRISIRVRVRVRVRIRVRVRVRVGVRARVNGERFEVACATGARSSVSRAPRRGRAPW